MRRFRSSVTLLAIETATDVCSVALHHDGAIVADATLRRPRQHAAHLVPLIDALLARCELMPEAIDVVAVSSGPGSYTGLRIGVSTAKGLAMATRADLVGVSTLEALALMTAPRAAGLIVPVFDARRETVYCAAYAADDEALTCMVAPCAVPIDELPGILPSGVGHIDLVGDGAELAASVLTRNGITVRIVAGILPHAAAVASLGARQWSLGERADLATFEPAYLREFAAKTPTRSAFEKLGF